MKYYFKISSSTDPTDIKVNSKESKGRAYNSYQEALEMGESQLSYMKLSWPYFASVIQESDSIL